MNTKRAYQLIFLMAVLSLALFGCGDDNTYYSCCQEEAPLIPFSEGTGVFVINTSGGDGGPNGLPATTATGGSGGDIDLYREGGPGLVAIVRNYAAVDASFTPAPQTVNLGSNAMMVTASTIVNAVGYGAVFNGTGLSDSYFLVNGSSNLMHDANGNGIANTTSQGDTRVTGISVAEGTILTLKLNNTSYASVSLNNDIDNHGTITTADYTATQRGHLNLYPATYHGASAINTSGAACQGGGHVYISANYSVFNAGMIDTSGGDCTTGAGGSGGYVEMYSDYSLENMGDIITSGGAASGAGNAGGDAGFIDIGSYYGSLRNSGNLSAMGGSGVTAGGNGDWVYLWVDYVGDLLNGGNINTSGGSATGGHGGYGGSLDMYAYGGSVVTSGDLTTVGGSTNESTSDGGDGGYIDIWNDYGYLYEYTPAGDIVISGNINTYGGSAVTTAGASGDGGHGGWIDVSIDNYYYPLDQNLALIGYTNVFTGGGDGNYGGYAGDVSLYNDYGYTDTGVYVPGGDVVNEADIDATGGTVVAGATATPADGGDGGYVYLETDYYYGMFNPSSVKTYNGGSVNVSGGASLESTVNYNGEAGDVWFWGYNGVFNSGPISANGGNDNGTNGGTTGYGNRSGYIEMWAELGPVENSADLTANGGDGEYRGGYAYDVMLIGATVSNGGNISSTGGDASVALSGSMGGDGGYVELGAVDGPAGIGQTGAVAISGGIGNTPGSDGEYVLGGQLVAP